RAVIALVYLGEHTTYAKLTAGFRISEGTTHAYAQRMIKILPSKAPSLMQALRRVASAHCGRVEGGKDNPRDTDEGLKRYNKA
ncbi:hypothetical protein ABZ523_35910, partial [Streptomyces lavendulocolor]